MLIYTKQTGDHMRATLETSATQISTDLTSSSQTSPFSWASWTTPHKSGVDAWAEKLYKAWEEQRFDDAIVQIDEYLDHFVPAINDLLIATGLFAKANCHLAMGRYEQALDFAEQVESKLNSHDSTLGIEVSFLDGSKGFLNQYKGFLLLNLGREEEAIQILRDNPPTCSFVAGIYRDIEHKLDIKLFDGRMPIIHDIDFSTDAIGPEKTLYDKLIGDWLSK